MYNHNSIIYLKGKAVTFNFDPVFVTSDLFCFRTIFDKKYIKMFVTQFHIVTEVNHFPFYLICKERS